MANRYTRMEDYRRALRLSQQELSFKLHISKTDIEKHEDTLRNPPHYLLDYLEMLLRRKEKLKCANENEGK